MSSMYKKYSHYSGKKNNGNKNNEETFPIKMKDVEMSKLKKFANKVRWDPMFFTILYIIYIYIYIYIYKYTVLTTLDLI